MMTETWAVSWRDMVGIVGVAMVVGTYFALQIGKLKSEALSYSVLNLIGAILILSSLLHTFNLASFIIEIFWLAISLIGMARWVANRQRSAG